MRCSEPVTVGLFGITKEMRMRLCMPLHQPSTSKQKLDEAQTFVGAGDGDEVGRAEGRSVKALVGADVTTGGAAAEGDAVVMSRRDVICCALVAGDASVMVAVEGDVAAPAAAAVAAASTTEGAGEAAAEMVLVGAGVVAVGDCEGGGVVGLRVGESVLAIGACDGGGVVGERVGAVEGAWVGIEEGARVGAVEGGAVVGLRVGACEGELVGPTVGGGRVVGGRVGEGVGGLGGAHCCRIRGKRSMCPSLRRRSSFESASKCRWVVLMVVVVGLRLRTIR